MSAWYWTIHGPEEADVLVLALAGLILHLGRRGSAATHDPAAASDLLIARRLLSQLSEAIRNGEFR